MIRRVLFALVLLATILADVRPTAAAETSEPYSRTAWTTGYVRHEFSPWTYDGTSIYEEGIAAASWDIPINSIVEVADVGTFRIADRGHLGSNGWIDIAVWSRADAYAITGERRICVYPPGTSPRLD